MFAPLPSLVPFPFPLTIALPHSSPFHFDVFLSDPVVLVRVAGRSMGERL